jgi:TolB-like protein
MTFVSELKRRNVFRVGVAYALAAWVILQGADFILEVIDAPSWILQVFVLVAAIGLPIVLIFSWVFEMTPEGLKRGSQVDPSQSITPQTGRKLDRIIIAFLALAVVALLVDRFLFSGPEVKQPQAAPINITVDPTNLDNAVSVASRLSVAVLPFLALSNGPDDEYFADGLTEEILNSLAQLPELLVTARTSAFHFKGRDLPVQDIAAQLGVAHIVEGSVRRSGERLRVTVQLVRASDGFHLWSEHYDRTAEDTIAVQEDIAEKIAVAMDVVMDEDKRESMRRAGLRDVEAFIALQKGLELFEEAHGADDIIGALRQTNRYMEIVQQRVPDHPVPYQVHSDLYNHILMNQATGQQLGDATEEEIANAADLAAADYRAVIEHARTPQERNSAELDLAFLASDWRRMPSRIERFSAEQGCTDSNWIDNIAVPFGFAAQIQHRLSEFRSCDPLRTTHWMSDARARLWSGDPEGALAVARQGLGVAPGEWLYMALVNALTALGQFETAEHEIALGIHSSTTALSQRMMVAAAQGDREKLNALYQRYREDPGASAFWDLTYYAWSGDRQNVNQLAAQIDQHPFAGPALATGVLWCNCGAPWDLDATPNFAGLIEDAGFAWPPPSPIRFPFKSW